MGRVWSVKCEGSSGKWEVWSVEWEVWSVTLKFGVRRAQCEVWSVKCEAWSVKEAVRSVKCGLWSVECEVWSLECEECSVKSGVWRLCYVSRWKKRLFLGNFRRLARVYVRIPSEAREEAEVGWGRRTREAQGQGGRVGWGQWHCLERPELNGWAQYTAQDPEPGHYFTPFFCWFFSSTPNCRAPMWDHYGRKDWISACGHGCPEQVSPGPFPGGNVARIDRGRGGDW